MPLEVVQHDAQIVMNRRVIRVESDRLFIKTNGIFKPAALGGNQAEQIHRIEVIGCGLMHLLEDLPGLVSKAFVVAAQSLLEQDIDILGRRLPGFALGFFWLIHGWVL